VRYRDVQLAATFAGDLERARRFVRIHLGELASDDDEHLRLRATLKVFLDEHGSRQATADRLGIHANTVGNRIRTCQDLLGDSVDRRPLELHVALALAERLGSAVLR
jgi:DNA-binding PucR family transcriptional regulator